VVVVDRAIIWAGTRWPLALNAACRRSAVAPTMSRLASSSPWAYALALLMRRRPSRGSWHVKAEEATGSHARRGHLAAMLLGLCDRCGIFAGSGAIVDAAG